MVVADDTPRGGIYETILREQEQASSERAGRL